VTGEPLNVLFKMNFLVRQNGLNILPFLSAEGQRSDQNDELPPMWSISAAHAAIIILAPFDKRRD
jgi:hypothetical protein